MAPLTLYMAAQEFHIRRAHFDASFFSDGASERVARLIDILCVPNVAKFKWNFSKKKTLRRKDQAHDYHRYSNYIIGEQITRCYFIIYSP